MNRHPLDAASLVFGLVFTVIGVVTLVRTEVPLGWLDPRVVLPVVALVVGVWLLASASRRRGDARGAPAAPEAADTFEPAASETPAAAEPGGQAAAGGGQRSEPDG